MTTLARGRRGGTDPKTLQAAGGDLELTFEVSGPVDFVAFYLLAEEEPFAFADGGKEARFGPRTASDPAFHPFADRVTLVRRTAECPAAVNVFLRLHVAGADGRPGARFFRDRWTIPVLDGAARDRRG